MKIITLNNKKFTYKIVRKKIRSIRLKLTTPKSFFVSCPYLTLDSKIEKFIQSNAEWIIKYSSKLISHPKLSKFKNLKILDQIYSIDFIKTQKDSILIFKDESKIIINTRSTTKTHLNKLFETKFRPIALSLIKKELQNLQKIDKFDYQKVTVRNQSSRYGSCSSKSNLNFNWQIIFFPQDKFRHILLHELTHLKIKNHSKIFWDQLTIYDPDCKQNNLWLKKEGIKHFIIKS